jgi:hypothetical protein
MTENARIPIHKQFRLLILDTPDVQHFGNNRNTPWYRVDIFIKNCIKRIVARDGFVAWWILQHVKGYKHLDTKIINNESFSGTLKSK